MVMVVTKLGYYMVMVVKKSCQTLWMQHWQHVAMCGSTLAYLSNLGNCQTKALPEFFLEIFRGGGNGSKGML